ncbi:hypothetical protein BX667DRAFT_519738 [Coemansia mojavensis]|nr:hypothetical protein BX667DRAFT_519738 [Coemansia mojavensis]
MHPPSLHTLPPLIVREIIHYIAEIRTTLSMTLAGPTVRFSLLWPLLHSCRAWRELALSVLFSRFEVTASGSQTSMTYLMNESAQQTTFHLSKVYTLLVKNIFLKLNLQSMADGTALAGVQSSELCSVHFARTRLLDVELTADSVELNSDSIHNIQTFMEYIEQRMPAVDNTELHLLADNFYANYYHSKGPGSLLSSLFDTLPMVSGSTLSSSRLSKTAPINTPKLAKVSCVWGSNSSTISRILHANSQSLIYLQVFFARGDDIEQLLLDDQNQPVVYPNLATLAMIKDDEFAIKRKTLPNFVPFPCLKVLYLDIEYPFGTELIFKANLNSLSSICIQVDDYTVEMLEKCQLLSKKVSLASFGLHSTIYSMEAFNEYRERSTEKNMSFTRTALMISGKLAISDMHISEALPNYLAANPIASNTQVLNLGCFLKLPSVLQLIKSLPMLRTLKCTVSGSNSDVTVSSSAVLLSTLQTEFNLSACSLKRWTIFNKGYFPYGPLMVSILIAVIMCPQLETIDFPRQKIETISNLFRRMQSSKLYIQHKANFTSKLVQDSPVPMVYFRHKYPIA